MGKFYKGLYDELSLFVRHCAWLNAVPEKPEGDKSKTPNPPRRKAIKEQLKIGEHDDLEMPPCDGLYLIGYLFEIGPSVPAGMGDGPLPHSEIEAWQRNTGIELQSWEARWLRRLSIEYIGESQRATKADYPAPWTEAPYFKSAAEQAGQSLKESLRELANL